MLNVNLRLSIDATLTVKCLDVPLLAPLIPDGLGSGSMILVEFDPEGQWLAVSRTIAGMRVKQKQRVVYAAVVRPREDVIVSLTRMGVDSESAEQSGLLRVDDYYSAALSGGSKEHPGIRMIDDRFARAGSLRVADLSIDWSKMIRGETNAPRLSKWSDDQFDVLSLVDSFSPLLRFNDEKTFLEWMESRNLPLNRRAGRVNVVGMARKMHTESLYARLEDAFDGLVEVRALEHGDEIKNKLRIRNLKGKPHDAHWHGIEIKATGEAVLTD